MRVLNDFRCPIHHRGLVEVVSWDGDDRATWSVVHFECPDTWPPHTFPARSDGIGGWVPIDDEADD